MKKLSPLFPAAAVVALVVAACGGGSSTSGPPTPRADRVPITLVPLEQPTPSPAPSPAPAITPSPAPTPAPSPATPSARPEPLVLAQSRFVHNGFRTQVTQTFRVTDPPTGQPGTVTVSLRNLSRPTGDLSSRATINFDQSLQNLVVLPTAGGPLTLHLHRDGSLQTAPDRGGFT